MQKIEDRRLPAGGGRDWEINDSVPYYRTNPNNSHASLIISRGALPAPHPHYYHHAVKHAHLQCT